ncbi:flagellar assembly protein FliW [Paenibacillus sp. HWE-109]|uniref:flagellar assembly protein FliW n=1 Tax=Paenibacillus sp. HWE-109 TaxID=1306526 RepID=UPI001EDCAECC|nr:flagellar assembly protein FliW [Paenibacillus sp. HWE-109]UKS26136.1 flagellar assembly protein FliW [Paenibacillus sp. HWE-109]
MSQLLHEKIIYFKGSILGFEEYDEFSISLIEENSAYAYLQSLQDESIAFLVIAPFVFFPDYSFEIDEKDKQWLDLTIEEDLLVFNTVTIKEPFTESTVNLLAPLVINIANGKARQIVLPPKSNYGTAVLLINQASEESGE